MKYGISFSFCEDVSALALKQFPKVFSTVEIPGHLLDNRTIFRMLVRKHISTLNISEWINPAVSRSIAIQSDKIISDFKTQLRERLENMSFPLDCLIIDLGLEEAASSEQFKSRLVRVVKELAMEMYQLKFHLSLPVRIPGADDKFTQFCVALKKKLMMPQVNFSIDIHPHELGREFDPEKILRWLKFDIGTVRFFYEPETGNRLVAKAVKPWIDYLKDGSFMGEVTFCPRCLTSESLMTEAKNISELLSGMD